MDLKKQRITLRIMVAVGGLFLATSIIPALLSASSDLAVILGVIIIIGIFSGGYIYGEKIINWFRRI